MSAVRDVSLQTPCTLIVDIGRLDRGSREGVHEVNSRSGDNG